MDVLFVQKLSAKSEKVNQKGRFMRVSLVLFSILSLSYKFLHALPCDLPSVADLKGIELSVVDQIKQRIFSYLQNLLTFVERHDFGDIQIHNPTPFILKFGLL